jgi:hypothetical protein
MNLVKIVINDDGDIVDNPKWHVIESFSGDPRLLCTGEVYSTIQTKHVKYETKQGKLKDCDCPKCQEIVKWFKSLK